MGNSWSWYPPPSRPITVEGGIKARSKRGAIAQTWWSERFIGVLESFGMGSRLSRGRNYARRGQVLALTIAPGTVYASVQGSRRQPYEVRIGFPAFGKADWMKLGEALAADAWYAAQLLAGEMPTDIEDLFASIGLSLFPDSARDLSMDCSCPDWSVPCKHIAAAFYLLAEEFDQDPFRILAWRGRGREPLLAALAAARSGGDAIDRRDSADTAAPLPPSPADFYAMAGPAPAPPGASPSRSDALCDQLPPLALTVRSRSVTDCLRPLYLALGER